MHLLWLNQITQTTAYYLAADFIKSYLILEINFFSSG